MLPESNADTLHLHHVGFVVKDIETSIPGFIRSLGLQWDGHVYHDELQRVKVAFLSTAGPAPQIELVEPVRDDSPVSKFLERGGGLHHLCYEVPNMGQALTIFKARKAVTVKRPLPAVAFGDRHIAWILTPEKLLVELLEQESSANEGTHEIECSRNLR